MNQREKREREKRPARRGSERGKREEGEEERGEREDYRGVQGVFVGFPLGGSTIVVSGENV